MVHICAKWGSVLNGVNHGQSPQKIPISALNYKNILDEQFNPDHPNATWCSDITYIWTIDGFVYLTSIMDLFSRKIIAWTLSETLEVSCVIDTINKAKARRNIDQPLIIHSDRGSQYVAKEYKKATENMQRSYSKKAFPWDNACIESFHSIIKREWLNRFKIRDYKQAYQLIFEYLEAFYNTKRIHSHCNYMSPNEFERVYKRTHTEAELGRLKWKEISHFNLNLDIGPQKLFPHAFQSFQHPDYYRSIRPL